MRLRKILGRSPVLVIKRVHEPPTTGVDFLIVEAYRPKGQRIRQSGFLPLADAITLLLQAQQKQSSKGETNPCQP